MSDMPQVKFNYEGNFFALSQLNILKITISCAAFWSLCGCVLASVVAL